MAVFTGNGSAASPSLTFSSDTNTGIFRPGADQLGLVTNGANRLFINSTGLVGVGTTSPAALLTVNGVGAFGAGAAATPSIARSSDLDTGMWFPATNTLALSTGGSERARIDSSGRLLVGRSSGVGTGRIQVQESRRVAGGQGRGIVEVVGSTGGSGSGVASGTVVDLATVTLGVTGSSADAGVYFRLEVFTGITGSDRGYTVATSIREGMLTAYAGISQVRANAEVRNLQASTNAGVYSITLATDVVTAASPSFTVQATPTITGASSSGVQAVLTYRLYILEGAHANTVTNLL